MPRSVWEHIMRMIEQNVKEHPTREHYRESIGYTVGHGGR